MKPDQLLAWSLLLTLSACTGGGGGEDGNRGSTGSTDTGNTGAPASVFATEETDAVKDVAAVYAVEKQQVLAASVITVDSDTWTFADINNDIDDTDASTPEIDAHMVIDGFPDDGKPVNATIRLRGHSSRLAEQKSYRIKLAKDAGLWRGEQTFQLNKHPWDVTRLRNKLAFDLFRDIAHIPSLRTQFVRMQVSNLDQKRVQYANADFGLFTHIEKMGKEYLANRQLPTDGNIYKAEDFDFTFNDNLKLDSSANAASKSAFETVLSLEADNKNHQTLLSMIQAVNDEGTPFDKTFGQYFDKSNYLTWLASSILLGNRDTINRNFALYQPKAGTRFYFLPWDYDGAFNFEDQPDQRSKPLYAPWQLTLANWWGVPLHRRFIQDARNLQDLKLAVDELYARYLTADQIKARLDAYKPLVQPLILADPDRAHLPLAGNAAVEQEWQDEVARIATVPKLNRDRFFSTLENPMPFWQAATLQANGSVLFTWDAAVDLQGDSVSYTVALARTPDFSSPLWQREVNGTDASTTGLVDGVYYLKVVARDSKGNIQGGFDVTRVGQQSYFGVYSFEINKGSLSRL